MTAKQPAAKKQGGGGTAMGVFSVDLGVGGAGGGELTWVSATVDTGATHSLLPAALLARLGIAPLERFAGELADGSVAEYDLGMARMGLNGSPERYCPVLFGPEGQYLVGATTLEFFNLMVDPVAGKLRRRIGRGRPL